jgi:hypothetical protein
MSLPAVKDALDKLDEKSFVEGTTRITERLAIMLPDGDVGAVEDPAFVDWLLEHAEVAPFGHAKKTKVDPKVRHAHRVTARGKAMVTGFDPATILDEIEAALSPRTHLVAKLTDVIVYPEGGKFERHKDTPTSPDLVGTLVVALPVAHKGGAFHLDDGREPHVVDWSGTPDPGAVRWVALFSDVDHAVKPVTSGSRVTLVYSLSQTDRPRADPTWEARRAAMTTAVQQLASSARWPVMIACSRHVITDAQTQPQPIGMLRGMDRDLADAIAAAGLDVAVRACIAACPTNDAEPGRFPDTGEMWAVSRLKKPLTAKAIAGLEDVATFGDSITNDEGEEMKGQALGPFILDEVLLEQWVIRDTARATMLHQAYFSETGYFGNEAYDAYIYTLAALEVTKHKPKPTTKPGR